MDMESGKGELSGPSLYLLVKVLYLYIYLISSSLLFCKLVKTESLFGEYIYIFAFYCISLYEPLSNFLLWQHVNM